MQKYIFSSLFLHKNKHFFVGNQLIFNMFMDKLINVVLLWTPTHGRANVGRPAKTYLHQLCADTGCSLEELPGRWMIGTDRKRESGKSLLSAQLEDADDIYIYIYIYTATSVYIYIYTEVAVSAVGNTYL